MNINLPHTGRPKFDYRTSNTENYKKFKKDNPDLKHIKLKEWRNIILDYTKMYREYILETGDMLQIPMDCGKFTIVKKKKRVHAIDPKTGKSHIVLPVDWKRSKELGKKVYFMNYHTDGYGFRWTWIKKEKSKSSIKFDTIWNFKAMKGANRLLHDNLVKDNKYQDIYKEWA